MNPDLEKDKNVADLLAKAEHFIHAKNFEEAINGCRAVLTVSPENQRARELLDEAQSRLEAQLFTRENLRKAQEFFRMRDFQKCINECQKIQLLEADNPVVSELLATAQQKVEAEPFVQNFISSGRSLFDSGLYEEAIDQWEKVRAIDPEYPDLDRLITNARIKLTSAGSADLTMPIDLSMPEAGAQEGFGFVSDQDKIRQLLEEGDRLYNNGQYQKAIEVWSEIFMVDVNHSEALQKIEQARAAAAEQRVKIKDILKNAQMNYEQGNIPAAYELFKEVKEIDPENSEAGKYLALIERPDREAASLEDLLKKAQLAEGQMNYREAAQYFSQALAIDSENADLADKIKTLNLLAKRQEQARSLLGNARGFIAENKLDSARHALSKILEVDPGNREALELLQQIKDRGAETATAVSAARVAAPRKPFPLIAAGILVLLAVTAATGYYFLQREETRAQESLPVRKVAKQPSAPSPSPSTGQSTSKAPGSQGKLPSAPVNETQNERVIRLVKEANFYLGEKHYRESLEKAEEALKFDPTNKDAIGLKLQNLRMIQDLEAAEKKMMSDADTYFSYSDFASAVKLYEKYLEKHPEAKDQVMPQILKSYYNLGVLAIREWRCDIAGDYFRQVLFIDETDQLSKEALGVARKCQKSGSTDIEVRKSVALMEIRR
jgi:tetratricopeptide (TPR) repeat protein